MQVGRARTSIRWATVGSAVVLVAAAAGCGGGVGGGPGVSASTTPAGTTYVDGNVARADGRPGGRALGEGLEAEDRGPDGTCDHQAGRERRA